MFILNNRLLCRDGYSVMELGQKADSNMVGNLHLMRHLEHDTETNWCTHF